MKALKNSLIVFLALSFSMTAGAAEEQASEGQTSIKIDEAKEKNKVDGNIDEEITNAKLRAESGSKSKWSGSLTAIYNGGSLEKPADRNRPNPTREPIAPKTSLGGSFGIRHRLDKNQSLSLTAGYSLERPFHEARRGQISNPSLNYNNAFNFAGVQNIFESYVMLSTDSDEREIGQIGTVGMAHTLMTDIGGSKASFGLVFDVAYSHFTKYNDVVQPKGSPPGQAYTFQKDYEVGVYPLFEYAFSDKLQFRTVFRPWIFRHFAAEDGATFSKVPWTQSIGIGYALTRDIYLYPNFQYDWERWRRDDFNWFRKNSRSTSTVGLNATINMF